MNAQLRQLLLAASLALLGAGAAFAAFGIGRALFGTKGASSPTAYSDTSACDRCPAGTRLDSVELQQRTGSTLVILRGRWPSIDALGASVRLVANDAEIVLKPHGSGGAFELATATNAGQPLSSSNVAAALDGDALLIDISPALPSGVRFEVGLWDGQTYLERLPREGALLWYGVGAPRLESGTVATSVPSAVTSPQPSAAPTPVGLDVVALARACAALPSGSVPPYLQIASLSSAVELDPRTQVQTQQVTAALAAPPAEGVAFAIGAVILPAGAAAPQGQASPIDNSGTEQLWVYTDGQNYHKGIRTYRDGQWTMLLDAGAGALTYRLSGPNKSASFFWAGLHPGDRFAFVTAAPSGCSAITDFATVSQ